jgi:hypothetical protein
MPSSCPSHGHRHPINRLSLKLHHLERSISKHSIQVRPPNSLLRRLQSTALEVKVPHCEKKGNLHLLHRHRLPQTGPLPALKRPPRVPRHLVARKAVWIEFCGIREDFRVVVHSVLHASDKLASSGELLAVVRQKSCGIFCAG